MKGKRVVALALTGCLMFGQTAWAEGTGGEKEQSEITQEEQTVDNSEQEDAGSEQTVVQSDDVTIKERPEDAIVFQDSNLESELLESWRGIDENGDGLITKSELLKLRYLYISNSDITNLSGLEYAENLEVIDVSGNKELKSIEPILNLNKIEQYNLKNTGISANDKWKLVKFSTEFDLALGEQANWITNGEFFDDDELIIEKQKGEDAGRIVGGTIVGVAAGEETIKI